jgi:hypothetical protein
VEKSRRTAEESRTIPVYAFLGISFNNKVLHIEERQECWFVMKYNFRHNKNGDISAHAAFLE